VEYLDLAKQKATKLNAMEEAKAYFYEAMELLSTLPETEENQQRRISLLVKQAEVFLLLFEIPEYYDLLTRYEPMAIELGNQALLGAFYSRVGHCEFGLGRFDKAIKTSTKAAELCEAAGNAEDAGFAYTWLEWSHLYTGDFGRALAVKENLLRTMEQRFNLRWYVRGLCAASRACICLGRWDEAVEECQKALNVAEEFSDNSMISWAAWNLSIAYTSKGDLARAIEYGEQAFQKASTPADKALAQRGLGWTLCRAGETNRGIDLLTAVLPIFQAVRWMPSVIPASCTLGEGYWLAGEEVKASQTLKKGVEIAERCGARYYVGWKHRYFARDQGRERVSACLCRLWSAPQAKRPNHPGPEVSNEGPGDLRAPGNPDRAG
jgi:tetratricopeptide (TPR) repeat protein